jgi:hypothetical protein
MSKNVLILNGANAGTEVNFSISTPAKQKRQKASSGGKLTDRKHNASRNKDVSEGHTYCHRQAWPDQKDK